MIIRLLSISRYWYEFDELLVMFCSSLRKHFLHPETWHAKDMAGSIPMAHTLLKEQAVRDYEFYLLLRHFME